MATHVCVHARYTSLPNVVIHSPSPTHSPRLRSLTHSLAYACVCAQHAVPLGAFKHTTLSMQTFRFSPHEHDIAARRGYSRHESFCDAMQTTVPVARCDSTRRSLLSEDQGRIRCGRWCDGAGIDRSYGQGGAASGSGARGRGWMGAGSKFLGSLMVAVTVRLGDNNFGEKWRLVAMHLSFCLRCDRSSDCFYELDSKQSERVHA